ncbi:winged helix-turn-helix domain-containing protein [Actinosynnema sp. NPDC051121]
MQAVNLFEQQAPVKVIAARLRCRRSRQLVRLQEEVDAGPAVHGWAEDQRWPLPRITTLVGRLFHVRYTQRGVSYLLHRLGWSPQAPVHRVVQRDEAAIAAWRQETRRAPGSGGADPSGSGVQAGIRPGVDGRAGWGCCWSTSRSRST